MLKDVLLFPAMALLVACAQQPSGPAGTAAPASAGASVPVSFRQAPLPYAADALEPTIDKATMEIHHGRHHKAYHDALNGAVAAHPELGRMSIEQVLANVSRYPAVVRNNAGGVWNHEFFWNSMAPAARRGEPSAALRKRIDTDFGSMENLQRQFNQAGAGRFGSAGSGWWSRMGGWRSPRRPTRTTL